MSLDLGQLVIELAGDYSQLQRDIEMAKQQALKQAAELEKIYTISPSLDLKSLQATADLAGISAGKSLAQGLERSLNSYKFSNANFKKAGESIAQGLVAGMKSGDSEIKNASVRMAGLIVDETKTKLKIKSPSKVFEEIGGEIVAGLSAGIGAGGALSISGFIQGIINDARSATATAIGFAGESVAKYSDFKATEAQLTSLTGSTAKATESLKFLRTEADKLALPFLDAAKSFTQLTAATNGTKLSGNTKDIFDGFSTAARAAQLSTSDYSGAMLGLIQMIGKGKITTQDLRQITDRLPGSMQLAAKSVGLTALEFEKLSQSGELTASVFLPRFAKALKEANVGTIAEATDTSTASLTKLNNRLDEVKVSLGKAIEPGVVAGLQFAQSALNELGKAGLFDDLNSGAKAFASYLRDNPQLAKSTADTISGVLKSAIAETVNLAQKLTQYLRDNPQAIQQAGTALVVFGKGIGDAIGFAQSLLNIFQNIARTVDGAYTKASKLLGGDSQGQNQFKNFLRFGPIALIPGSPFAPKEDSPQQTQTPAQTVGNAVKNQAYAISQSVGSKLLPVNSYSDLTKHHPSSGIEQGRDYDDINGKLEEVRKSGNSELVKKDFILQSGDNQNVQTPSPASGYARIDQAWGGVAIYSQKIGGELLANVLHLRDILVKTGQAVQYGQPLGTQSNVQDGSIPRMGVHSHIELPPNKWPRYIQDLQSGRFGGIPTPSTVVKQAVSQSQPSNEGWMRTRASYYGKNDGAYQSGTATASGIPLSDTQPQTAINENLKNNLRVNWGDRVQIYNPASKQSVVVSVVDSGPYAVDKKTGRILKDARGNYVPSPDRGFDLNETAKKQLNFSGLGEIWFKVLGQSADYARTVAQSIAKNSASGTGTSTGSKIVGAIDPTNQPPEVRAALAGSREKDSAERRQKLRQAQLEQTQSFRSLQDLDYSANKTPSLSDRQAEESRKLVQNYNNDIRSTTQKQEDARSRIIINESKLKSGSVAPGTDEAKELQLQIDVDKKAIAEYTKVLELLDKTRAKATANLAKYQDQQRAIQQRGQSFDLRQSEIGVQTANIQALKTFQAANPTDPRVDLIPSLEREIALKNAQLNLDKQIASITDSENKNEITPAQADARLQLLDRENALQITNIQLTYQSAIAAQTLAKAKLSLAKTVRDNNSQVEFLRQDAQLSEYGFGGNRLSLENQANKIELQTKYAQDKVGLLETAKKEGFTPEQTNGEKLRLAIRFNKSNLLNNASFKRNSEDEAFSNYQRLQQSKLDVLSAQSEALQVSGLTTFDKPVQKQIAIQQQLISYQNQIQELQKLKDSTDLSNADFIMLKTNIENINTIKLDSINQSFSDLSEVVKGFASDFQSVTKDFILNSSNIGESFSKLIQSLLSQFAQLASKQLSDQLFSFLSGKGKYQGSNQDNSGGFGQILSSIGSLFGGGSGGSASADYSSFLGNGSSTDSFSFLGGFASGGMVGDIAKTMQRETLLSGNKAHLIVANDGERVLTPAETQMWNRLQSAGRLPSYADGGIVGASGGVRVINGVNSGDSSVNVGGITVMVGGNASDINVPQLQKVLEAQIQKTIKQERRPGGSLTRGNPYDR